MGKTRNDISIAAQRLIGVLALWSMAGLGCPKPERADLWSSPPRRDASVEDAILSDRLEADSNQNADASGDAGQNMDAVQNADGSQDAFQSADAFQDASQDGAQNVDAGPGLDAGHRADTRQNGDSGPGSDGSSVLLGESCLDALPIAHGYNITNSTQNAADDISVNLDSSNTGVGAGGADRVFGFTLTEMSGVEITLDAVDSDFDPVLYVLRQGCGVDDLVSGALSEDTMGGGIETIIIGQLAAGDYYIVVDSWISLPNYPETSGAFSLALTLTPGGICVADEVEDNNTVADATEIGARNINTSDLEDPDTPGPDPFELNICGDDDDYYIVPHMGGTATVDLSRVSGQGSLSGVVYNMTYQDQNPVQGSALGPMDFSGVIDRGHFLLHISASNTGNLGLSYAMNIEHGCLPDRYDEVLPDEDDEVAERAFFILLDEMSEAIERTICQSDKDTFVLRNVVAGQIVATITNGENLGVSVYRLHGTSENWTMTPYSSYSTQTSGSNLIVTMPNAAVGDYAHVINAGSPAVESTTDYTYNATFAGVATPPANDTCAGAQVLTPGSLSGITVGANDNFTGLCNGDADAETGVDGAPEVFYRLHLAQQNNLMVEFDGTEFEFEGSVSLFHLTSGICPTNLTSLSPVQIDGNNACQVGQQQTLRLPDLAAGDYLIMVDGVYAQEYELFDTIFPEVRSSGRFNLTAMLYPDGFPPTAACANATEVAVPVSGQSYTAPVVNTSNLSNDFEDYGDCSTGGRGNEVAFILSPTTNANVTITTSGYDTILQLRQDHCFGPEVFCNDDSSSGVLGSEIQATLLAGTTYYVIVDKFGVGGGELTVTFETQ